MLDDRPKACINSKCNNTFYVHKNMLHMCLQCPKCVARKAKERATLGISEGSTNLKQD